MLQSNCPKCMLPSDNIEEETVVCSGFCETAWHRICTNTTKTCFEIVGRAKNQNFLWFCDRCALIVNNNLWKDLFNNSHSGLMALVGNLNAAVDNLNLASAKFLTVSEPHPQQQHQPPSPLPPPPPSPLTPVPPESIPLPVPLPVPAPLPVPVPLQVPAPLPPTVPLPPPPEPLPSNAEPQLQVPQLSSMLQLQIPPPPLLLQPMPQQLHMLPTPQQLQPLRLQVPPRTRPSALQSQQGVWQPVAHHHVQPSQPKPRRKQRRVQAPEMQQQSNQIIPQVIIPSQCSSYNNSNSNVSLQSFPTLPSQFNFQQNPIRPAPIGNWNQNQFANNTYGNLFNRIPSNIKYLFISRMSLATTEQDVFEFMLSYVGVRCVSCHLIKGRTNGTPNFVSFKIGLSTADFTRVTQQNVWPPGMVVREFVDKPSNIAMLPNVNQLHTPQQAVRLPNFYTN